MLKENLDPERVMGEEVGDHLETPEKVGESVARLPDADRVIEAEGEAGLPVQISAWGGKGTKRGDLERNSQQNNNYFYFI